MPNSWACGKRTAVSPLSTEAAVTSMNIGPRIEGLLALQLLDTAIEVVDILANRASGNPSRQPKNPKH